MVFLEKPTDFNPRIEVVSCSMECDGTLLLLQTSLEKSQSGKWGMPAGKMEIGETPVQALVRELHEETGITAKESDLEFFKTVYVRYPDIDFIYHMFIWRLDEKPNIVLVPREHINYQWVTPEDALKLPLIDDEEPCIRLKFGFKLNSSLITV